MTTEQKDWEKFDIKLPPKEKYSHPGPLVLLTLANGKQLKGYLHISTTDSPGEGSIVIPTVASRGLDRELAAFNESQVGRYENYKQFTNEVLEVPWNDTSLPIYGTSYGGGLFGEIHSGIYFEVNLNQRYQAKNRVHPRYEKISKSEKAKILADLLEEENIIITPALESDHES